MKNKKQKIISFVIAAIVGFADYFTWMFSNSMCYYAGDGHENFIELRNICYAKYSIGKMWLEITVVFVAVYLIVFYVFKLASGIRRYS